MFMYVIVVLDNTMGSQNIPTHYKVILYATQQPQKYNLGQT